MRSSLTFKLIGAFLVVIAAGALMISWLASQAMQSEFRVYTSRNSQAWGQRLAPVLADFYAHNGNWQGVDSILQSEPYQNVLGTPLAAHAPGSGAGQGLGLELGRQSAGMWGSMGQHIILADQQGLVVVDTRGELNGTQLSPAEIKNRTPIMVNTQLVGTLMVSSNDSAGPNTPAGQFLASVNHSIIVSVIVASLIALILGMLLLFQITAPLQQLRKAAHAIAQGDLSQRVDIRSYDEFGELGEAFNHMAENLDKAGQQRRQLVADIAHELRTPLTVIQANLEGMLDGIFPLDVEQVSALHTETLLLNRLVGDLRLLSLAEAGELKLEQQEANLGNLIRKIAERAKPHAQQKGVALDVDIPADLPDVWMDSDRITQVLNNLLGNSLRYTPQAGTITLQAQRMPNPLDNTVPQRPAMIAVSVTDSGPGIAAEDLPHVFDRFYRADKSRARASGGSGLGLAIVKQLVKAHGGQIQATSPVLVREDGQGYGTCIRFTLPVQK